MSLKIFLIRLERLLTAIFLLSFLVILVASLGFARNNDEFLVGVGYSILILLVASTALPAVEKKFLNGKYIVGMSLRIIAITLVISISHYSLGTWITVLFYPAEILWNLIKGFW